MLSIQEFTDEDFAKIHAIPKAIRLYFIFFLFCIAISFLLGALGLLKKGPGYWLVTLGLVGFFIVAFLGLVITEVFSYLRDRAKRQKYTGTLRVVSKSEKKNESLVYLDDANVKKILVFHSEVFEKISEADLLTIEISRYSKYLFRLEKEGEDLLQTANRRLANIPADE